MIIEYDATGRIFHVISDPVPDTLSELMAANGHRFIEIPPKALPEAQLRDHETGQLLFDEKGDPLMGSPGLQFAECDMSTDYVVGGKITRRPQCKFSTTVEGMVITMSDLPKGSRLAILLDPEDASSAVRTDAEGSFSFEVDEPGMIRIHVTPPWPMQDEVIDVEVE